MSDDWKGIQEELSQKNFELVKAREKGCPGPELQAINSEISRLETEKKHFLLKKLRDMSDEWKWNKFVEIGNTIHKLRGVVRTETAQDALGFVQDLRKNGFIRSSNQRFALYETLLPKIACYLDGNAEVIHDAVREYFLIQHCKARRDENALGVSFSSKKGGIQTGFICDVTNGTLRTRYYVKTHQHGPTEQNPKSLRAPDTKEMFIYEFLHRVGLGPEAHFIIPFNGEKKTIYIATKDCQLTLLSQLTKDIANNKALLQLDLISRILCLRDCTTNTSNCGQVGEKAMIVDFRIDSQTGYFKKDILDKFYTGNCEFRYVADGLMETAVKSPNADKLDIMKASLKEWNLLESIERVESEIQELVQRLGSKIIFANDLQLYVQGIKATVQVLMKA